MLDDDAGYHADLTEFPGEAEADFSEGRSSLWGQVTGQWLRAASNARPNAGESSE